jgi:hypothetical protein
MQREGKLRIGTIAIIVGFVELFFEAGLLIAYLLGFTSSVQMNPMLFISLLSVITLVDLVLFIVFAIQGGLMSEGENQIPLEKRFLNHYSLHFIKVFFGNLIFLIGLIIWLSKYFNKYNNPTLPDDPKDLNAYLIYKMLFLLGIFVVYYDFNSLFNLISMKSIAESVMSIKQKSKEVPITSRKRESATQAFLGLNFTKQL